MSAPSHPTRFSISRFMVVPAIAATAVCGVFLLNRPATTEARSERPAVAAQKKPVHTGDFRDKFRRPEGVEFPADNTFSEARADLGKTLFFDPRLSKSDFISCATCHNPAFSWGDGMAKGVGHGMKTLGRRTPTALNTAYASALFWDGRADSLEQQALGPIASPGEMAMPLDELIVKLNAIPGYQPLFEKAYPGEGITTGTVAKAIATFERTIVSGEAPFDRFVNGDDSAISEAAKHGFQLFNTTANCVACHSGWNFTDDSFHDIGVPGDDIGRGKFLKEIAVAQHAFKTPTLRNATLRAPFMHDGSEATLEQVVELYDLGGREKRASLSKEIKPLHLSASDKRDLVEFLKTLTGEDKPVTVPVLPH